MDKELKKLRREISTAKGTLKRPQSYGAQVIGYTLKHIAEKFGKVEANKAIVELGLEKCGWKQET